MIVKSIYPNCKLKNGVHTKKGVDAFWVACLPNEAKEIILPLASQKEKERISRLLLAIQTIPMEDISRDTWKSATEGYCNCNHIYFLILGI